MIVPPLVFPGSSACNALAVRVCSLYVYTIISIQLNITDTDRPQQELGVLITLLNATVHIYVIQI